MKKLNLLSLLIFSMMITSIQIQAQRLGDPLTLRFENEKSFPLQLKVMSEAADGKRTIKKTVDIDGGVGAFRKVEVNIGDFVFAETTNNGKTLITTPMYVNGSRAANSTVYLDPRLPFEEFALITGKDAQLTRYLGIASNLYGVNILDYNPKKVVESISGAQIFQGFGKGNTTSYYLDPETSTVLPTGFKWAGADNLYDGQATVSEYIGIEKFKKAWNVSASGSIPIKKAKVDIDFSYGETFTKNSTQTDAFYLLERTGELYKMTVDINEAYFHPQFIKDVAQVTSPAKAKWFIDKYGTHYSKRVTYGGLYTQYTKVKKSDYYEAKRKDLNLSLGVSVSQPGKQTTTFKDGTLTKSGSPASSEAGSGKVGFSQTTDQSTQRILTNSESKYYAVGGRIDGSGQYAIEMDNASAIDAQLGEIVDLFDASVLKSRLLPGDLVNAQKYVQAELDKRYEQLKKYPKYPKVRAFEFRMEDMKVTYHPDDADKRAKGNLKAIVREGNQDMKTFTLFDVKDYVGTIYQNERIIPLNPQEKELTTRAWHTYEQHADANGNFKPLTIDFVGSVYDSDHCCGNEQSEIRRGEHPTKPLSSNQLVVHEFEMKDRDHLVWQDFNIKTKVVIKPILGFPGLPGSANRSATFTDNGRVQKPKITPVNVSKMSKEAFENYAIGGKATTVSTTAPGGTTKSSTKHEVKFHNQAGITLAQAQAIANSNGWTVATAAEVQDAWANKNLDVYAFGLMADGRFAVPVQSDHSNFKKGPNIGATGGNQGFLYTVPTKPEVLVVAGVGTPTKTTTTKPAAPTQTYAQIQIEDNLHHKVLISGDVANNRIYHQDANNRTNAKWIFKSTGDGYYNIIETKHNLALVAGDNADNNVYHQNPNGRDNAKWKLEPVGDGNFHITDKKHGRSLVAGTSYDGNVYHQTPQGRKNAIWKLTIVGAESGIVPIEMKNSGNTTTKPAEPTAITPTGDGYVRIQNSWYKKNYVHNQNGTIEQSAIQPNWWSAMWKIVPAHSGWVRIQNRWYPDQYLHNQNGKLEVGKIQNNWASALWKLVPVHSGWVRIQNSWYKDRYIHNQNGKIEVGPIQNNWASAMWKVE